MRGGGPLEKDLMLPVHPALVNILVIICQEGHHQGWIYKHVCSVEYEPKNKK